MFSARDIIPWSDPECPDQKSGSYNTNLKGDFLNITDFKYKGLGT